MKCIYCNRIFELENNPLKCRTCNTYHDYDECDFRLRSVTFFKEIDGYTYRVTHDFENSFTKISGVVIVRNYVTFKHILKMDVLDITPETFEWFVANKLKLYTVFS